MNGKIKIKSEILLLCRCAMLSAAGIVLSIIESILPDFPFILPGIKPGLANIAVMIGLETVGFFGTLAIVILKSGFVLLTRGAVAAMLSLCGGILSFLVMYLCTKCKKPQFGSIGIGIAGAFSHNMGQLAAASILVGNAVYGYGAALSVISLLTGTLTGLSSGIILHAVPFNKFY